MENTSFSHDQHIPSFSQNSCTGASAADRPDNDPDTAVDQIFRPRPTAISREDDVVAIEQETGSIAHDTAEGWSKTLIFLQRFSSECLNGKLIGKSETIPHISQYLRKPIVTRKLATNFGRKVMPEMCSLRQMSTQAGCFFL